MFQQVNLVDTHCPYCKEDLSTEEVDDVVQLAEGDRTNVSLVLPCEACGEIIEIFVNVVAEAQVSINKV